MFTHAVERQDLRQQQHEQRPQPLERAPHLFTRLDPVTQLVGAIDADAELGRS